MVDQKTTQLTELTDPSRGDLLYAIDDPLGIPLSRKLKIETLLAGPAMFVAAYNATIDEKRNAHFVCDGIDDEVEIQAAINALPTGTSQTGDTIWLSSGLFSIQHNTISILNKPGINIRGMGKRATRIASSLNTDLFFVDEHNTTLAFFGFSDFWMQLLGTGDGIVLGHNGSNYGEIERIRVTGGAVTAWGINAKGSNVIKIDSVYMQCNCNGIIWHSVPNGDPDFGWGDSTIIHTEIALTSTGTTGIMIAGIDGGAGHAWLCNNIMLAQVEVTGGAPERGNTGIHLRNTKRDTLINVDLENLATGLLLESGQGGGHTTEHIALINVYPLNCTNDYTVVGTPADITIIGGDGAFVDLQQLPTGLILTAPDASKHRIIVANDGTLSTEVVV